MYFPKNLEQYIRKIPFDKSLGGLKLWKHVRVSLKRLSAISLTSKLILPDGFLFMVLKT